MTAADTELVALLAIVEAGEAETAQDDPPPKARRRRRRRGRQGGKVQR